MGDLREPKDKHLIKGDWDYICCPCLYCNRNRYFAPDSPTANGVFNSFCDGDCEDLYALQEYVGN